MEGATSNISISPVKIAIPSNGEVGRTGDFQFLKLDPLDLQDWDELVDRFPQANPFHRRSWLKTLSDTYHFTPIAIALAKGQSIEAILVLCDIDCFISGKKGVALPFTDICPPLSRSEDSMKPLQDASVSFGLERKWKSLELRFGRSVDPLARASQEFYQHELKLHSNDGGVFRDFTSSTRRAIRKAERSGVSVESSDSIQGFRDFFTLVCHTRKRHGLPPQPWKFFEKIHGNVVSHGDGILYLARIGSQPIAGAFFLKTGIQSVYKFGASDLTFQETRANNLVMWTAIQEFSQNGFKSLDFGRTSLSNSGLRRFKLGWGAQERTLSYFQFDLKRSKWVEKADQSEGLHNRIFRLMPIPMLKLVGSLIYKYAA